MQDDALNTFIAESDELLAILEADLLKIGDGENNSELMNEIFRCAHTIKGSAGLFGLDNIVHFTHALENIYDRARDRDITIDDTLLPLLLKGCDHIQLLVESISNSEISPAELETKGEQLLKALSPWLSSNIAVSEGGELDSEAEPGVWHISFKLAGDALANGMDPISIIKYLAGMGNIAYISTLYNALPVDQFNPEELYLHFELGINTDKPRSELEEAFTFVRDGSDITIIPPNSSVKKYVELIKTSATGDKKLGQILLQCGAITELELECALRKQQELSTTEGRLPLGEILLDDRTTSSEVIAAAVETQVGRRPTKSKYLRIEADRLDSLINLIGETVISHQRIDLITNNIANVQLEEAVADMKSLTEQVRDAALVLRMVPIGETFQKFKRVVRDVASSLNKDIHLELSGEETELDRSMVEKISDPITHIVRNAIDHGIEEKHLREERGKPGKGLVKLSSHHDSGNIVITIYDDGGGLDTDKIRTKALDAGVITPDVEYSNHDLQQLIFHPGLSTAESVTNLSGRGVGMDVVKRNIEELQGNVSIDSVAKVGTSITIRLPLTLAIIDGFHVASSNTSFIVPHNAIVECLDFDSIPKIDGVRQVNLRGDMVPYLELSELFSLPSSSDTQKKLLVVRFGNDQAGILVDELYGELQTVVKPLSPLFSKLKGIGGSSLLGSGDIAFILDVPQLIEFAIRKENMTTYKESTANDSAH